jgi:cysteine desulfurase
MEIRNSEVARILPLRERLMTGLLEIDGAQLTGDHIRRLPNNVNASFKGIEGEELVIRLDAAGIAVSTGSACKGGSEPSHVLAALGLSPDRINSSVRFTLGRSTTEADILRTIATVRDIVLAARFG